MAIEISSRKRRSRGPRSSSGHWPRTHFYASSRDPASPSAWRRARAQATVGLPYRQLMRFLKNHPWVQPGASLGDDVDWNLWTTRQPPFSHLEKGDTVWIAFGDTRVGPSQIEWEVEITKVATAYYRDLRHAWRMIAEQFPVSQFPAMKGTTWQWFSSHGYTRTAPAAGWLLAYSYEPVRHIGIPRPAQLRFRPTGWLPLDHLSDAELTALGLIAKPPARAGGRRTGWMADAVARAAVENRAMVACRSHLRSIGWADHEIEDTHATRSYDFECQRGKAKALRVEVKGTTGQLGSVELTRREVEHAQTTVTDLALFVLTGVTLTTGRGGTPVAKGGTAHWWHPWNISEGHLVASRFDYTPPVP